MPLNKCGQNQRKYRFCLDSNFFSRICVLLSTETTKASNHHVYGSKAFTYPIAIRPNAKFSREELHLYKNYRVASRNALDISTRDKPGVV